MLEFFIFISFFLFLLILLQQRKKKLISNFFLVFFLINISYVLFYLLFSKISFNNFIIVLFSLILSQSISLLLLQGVRSSIQIKLLKEIDEKKELSEKDIDIMDKEIFLDRINNLNKNNIIENVNNKLLIKNNRILLIYYFFLFLKKIYNSSM